MLPVAAPVPALLPVAAPVPVLPFEPLLPVALPFEPLFPPADDEEPEPAFDVEVADTALAAAVTVTVTEGA